MASLSTSQISRILLVILFCCLTCTVIPAQTQDYTEEEYKAFQDIQAATDPAKKVELAAKLLAEKPKTALRPNVMAEYQNAMIPLQKEKNWNLIISLGEKFLDAVPGDEFTVGRLAAAYESTGNTKGFATFGEKLYSSKPDPKLAQAIAGAYLKLGNDAKFLQWGEKTLAGDPDNYAIAAELTGRYLRNQNTALATKYAVPQIPSDGNQARQCGRQRLEELFGFLLFQLLLCTRRGSLQWQQLRSSHNQSGQRCQV
jgi:tetratricopeptide (TPR) repeat protein